MAIWRFGEATGLSLARPRAWLGIGPEGRAIDRLAWPIIAEGLLQTALELTNLALVGRLGTAALSGVGAATQLIQLGIAALGAVSIGGMVIAAQAYGARDERSLGRIVGQSLTISVVVGLILGLPAAFFAPFLLRLIGTSEAVAAEGAVYLRFAGVAFPALALMTVAAAILRGLGRSRTPMVVTGLANLINVSISATLIFGPPHLGITGAATGAAVARVAGMLLLLGALGRAGLLRDARLLPDMPLIRRIMRVGLPSLGEQLILNFGLLVYGLLALRLGTATFAAQRVTLTLIGLAWMPAFGYGAGATALIGQAIGAGDPERARVLARTAATLAILWMSGLAVVCFIFAHPLIGIFTSDPTVRDAAATGLRVLCLGQPFWGLGQVYAGALRGTGDTRYPMWATAAGVWLVRLPTAWLFGLTLGMGLPGIFISNGVDAATRGALVTYRFVRGTWRERLAAREGSGG